MLRFFSCLALFFVLLDTPLHAQLYELPFEEIIDRSALIVEGRALARESLWDNQNHNIYTSNTIQISRIFKGANLIATGTLQVITQGGIVGSTMHRVSESVEYGPGDVGLFCLLPSERDLPLTQPIWENYGSPHGFFQYDLATNQVAHPFHAFSGITAFREHVRQQTRLPEYLLPGEPLESKPDLRATPVISSFTPTSLTAGTQSEMTISGSNFGATAGANGAVRFQNSNAASGYFDSEAFDIVSWSDNEIVVMVPSRTFSSGCAGTGTIQVRNSMNQTGTSSGTLTVEFAHSNVMDGSGNKYQARIVENNPAGGMTFTFSTSLCSSGNQDAANAFARALRNWRCASSVNWEIEAATTTVNGTFDDGINIVTFDVGSPLGSGILGQTTSRYSACSSSGWNWWVVEVDVNLNNSFTWYYCDNPNAGNMPAGSYDFQSVAFHELGHGHQLSHIIDASAVMHRSISNNTIKRTLNANELAGANYSLSLSPNPCGPDLMTLINPSDCTNMTMPAACDDAGPCTLSLPVELVAFSGTAEKSGIRLTWATASEHNNAYFTLERAADAVHFSELTRTPGVISSAVLRQYEFMDAQPLPGLNYYRLRQTDLDGSESLLGIIAVAFGSTQEIVQVYPNPVSSEAFFVQTENIPAGAQLEFTLTDLLGNRIRQITTEPNAGAFVFPMENIAPGAYLFFVYNLDNRQLLKETLLLRQ
ncbi:MAG: IPT/TIG domain-containing protein [Lewinellaceae bacterium]|nr:IPT/TIG domain-containing protein [Lewinellaceae bacterium]